MTTTIVATLQHTRDPLHLRHLRPSHASLEPCVHRVLHRVVRVEVPVSRRVRISFARFLVRLTQMSSVSVIKTAVTA